MQLMHLKTRDPKPSTKGKGDSYSQGRPPIGVIGHVSVMDLIEDGWTLLGPPVIYSLEFHWYLTKE